MKRGDLYRVYKGSPNDTKNHRIFVIVSRQVLIDSKFSTLICAPVYNNFDGLSTQIIIGIQEGLKHTSAIFCDELVSLKKSMLTDYIGSLSMTKLNELKEALKISLDIED